MYISNGISELKDLVKNNGKNMISKQLAELISSIQSDSEKVCKNQKDLQEQDFFPDNEGFATKKSKKKLKEEL